MLKGQVWECDTCGKTEQSDGFPENWIEINIQKGDFYSSVREIDKDCCCQICANKVVLDYYSAHRMED